MTRDDRLVNLLTDWLEHQPTSAPDRLLDAVLTDLQSTPQRARWEVALRSSPMFGSNGLRFSMALGAVALAAVVGIALSLGQRPIAPADEPATPTIVPARESEFVPTGNMSQGCAWCPAALLEDGRVLVVGGWSLVGHDRPRAELYDPVSGTFSTTGFPGDDFSQAFAVGLQDGRVLIGGGLSERADIYDPMTGQFQATGLSYPQGQGGVGVALADGRVLMMRGINAAAEVYDPDTGDVTQTDPGPIHAGRVTATLLEDGNVLVVGSGTAHIYDSAARTFSKTGPMTVPRDSHTATRLRDGRVLLVGGALAAEPYDELSSAELYDPETGTFSETGSMQFARVWHTSVLLSDGRVLVAGAGMGGSDRAEIYDPATGKFTLVGAAMSQPRQAATAVTLADGRVLVIGHYRGNVPGVSPGSEFPSNTAELFVP